MALTVQPATCKDILEASNSVGSPLEQLEALVEVLPYKPVFQTRNCCNTNYEERLRKPPSREHCLLFRRWLSSNLSARRSDIHKHFLNSRRVAPIELFASAFLDFITPAERLLFDADIKILSALASVDRTIMNQNVPTRDWRVSAVLSSVLRMRAALHLTLRDVSPGVGLSPRYLGKLFYHNTGLSFHKFVRVFRVAHAADALCRSFTPIKAVAALCGYTSPNNFIRDFTAETGLTPSQYRTFRKLVEVGIACR